VPRPRRVDVLGSKTIAIPSERSTGYLLYRKWATEQADIKVLPFHEIMPAVAAGDVRCGLVIHEARFTYPSYGLTALVDLGEWWETTTGLPIPLGAIIARKGLDTQRIAGVNSCVGRVCVGASGGVARVRARICAGDGPAVAEAHIGLYVNEFTRELGDEDTPPCAPARHPTTVRGPFCTYRSRRRRALGRGNGLR